MNSIREIPTRTQTRAAQPVRVEDCTHPLHKRIERGIRQDPVQPLEERVSVVGRKVFRVHPHRRRLSRRRSLAHRHAVQCTGTRSRPLALDRLAASATAERRGGKSASQDGPPTCRRTPARPSSSCRCVGPSVGGRERRPRGVFPVLVDSGRFREQRCGPVARAQPCRRISPPPANNPTAGVRLVPWLHARQRNPLEPHRPLPAQERSCRVGLRPRFSSARRLGPVNTYLSASKMSTKWMKLMNITSSFSNLENIRR